MECEIFLVLSSSSGNPQMGALGLVYEWRRHSGKVEVHILKHGGDEGSGVGGSGLSLSGREKGIFV